MISPNERSQAKVGVVRLQDPNAGPAMVGNACTQVNSVSVPRMSVQWTCGIAVQGDYACGGGMSLSPSFSGARYCL